MERKNQLQSIKNLPVSKFCKNVHFLTDDIVVTTTKLGCSLMEVKNNKEIKIISYVPCDYVVVDQLYKKIAFSHDNIVEIYNAVADTYEWERKEQLPIKSIHFGSNNNTIFLHVYDCNKKNYGIITKHTYGIGSCSYEEIIHLPCTNFVFHPKKPIMCALKDSSISVYDLSNKEQEPRVINMNHTIGCCHISLDGIIATRNMIGDKISIINLNKESKPHDFSDALERFFDMLFYPKGPILFTRSKLSSRNDLHIVRYWNVKTRQCIFKTFLIYSTAIWNCSFSPDGKNIAFIIDEKSAMYSVPLVVRYVSIKETYLYFLWLVKNCIEQQMQNMPKDIVELVVYKCIEILHYKNDLCYLGYF